MIGGNISQRDQSYVNTRHDVLDWFGSSREVIVIRPVLMYYAIEIDFSFFLSRSPRCGSILSFSWDLSGSSRDLLDVDLLSLFIVGEPAHRI
jgi:hypothetical protein